MRLQIFPVGEPQLSSLGSRHAEQIEVMIHLYQLVSFNAVNPLWRGECIKITRRVFAETHITVQSAVAAKAKPCDLIA